MELVEIWKPVNDYEGFYEVSNLGRIRSLSRTCRNQKNPMIINGMILKPSIHQSGYMRVNLCKNGKPKSFYVHVLILEAFVCKRPNRQDVDHKDHNRQNNKLSNLRWLSYKENRGKVGLANNNNKLSKILKHKLCQSIK